MLAEEPDDILRKTFCNVQGGVRSVVYTVEQLMLNLLQKSVIGISFDSHIAKFFHTYEAFPVLSKRLLASSSFMAPIATFARRKTDTAMNEKKISFADASEELIGTVQTFNNGGESLPSCCDSRGGKAL